MLDILKAMISVEFVLLVKLSWTEATTTIHFFSSEEAVMLEKCLKEIEFEIY